MTQSIRTPVSKAKWNRTHFNEMHGAVNASLRRLSATKKRRGKLSSHAITCLKRGSQPWLPAVNLTARIAVTEEMIKAIGESAALRRQMRYFAITLVPETKLVRLDGSDPIDISGVKTAVHRTLAGLSYIGAIDFAAYRQFPTASEERKNIICAHAHVLVWGCDEMEARRIVSNYNRETRPMLKGFRPGDCRSLSGVQRNEWLRYSLKFPVKEYQLVERPEEDALGARGHKTSRWKQPKKPIRPGTAALLASKMAQYTIPDLLLSGGKGGHITREAVQNARQRLTSDLQRSTRKNVRRVFGREAAMYVDDLIDGMGFRPCQA